MRYTIIVGLFLFYGCNVTGRAGQTDVPQSFDILVQYTDYHGAETNIFYLLSKTSTLNHFRVRRENIFFLERTFSNEILATITGFKNTTIDPVLGELKQTTGVVNVIVNPCH